MGGQLSMESAEWEERQLEELRQAEGEEFPGSDFVLDSDPLCRKEWMAKQLPLDKVRVRNLVWPGTHDSATDCIGIPFITRPFAQCQSMNIYEQLVKGVRSLDIRVEESGCVCHGILRSYSADDVLASVKRFLEETSSEFILLEIRTEYGHLDPPEFDKKLIETLGNFLIPQDPGVFNCTLQQLLPKRLICVWKPQKAPAPMAGSPLWNSSYLRDNWIDTDLPYTKFESNMKHLEEQGPNEKRQYFYRVENTATPQATSLVACVKPITFRILPYARLFLSQAFKRGLGDNIQIFTSDFIQDDFVDACIGITKSRILP